MGDEHSELTKKKRFCQIRGTPCLCGNHYQDNCKPTGRDWFIKFEIGKSGTKMHTWEAHHILSVSCVAEMPKNKVKAVRSVQRVTDWCINAKNNMIAMPKFGQTIMYYSNVKSDHYWEGDFEAPSFKNIPQHDFEHNTAGGYCTEVKKDIIDLWKEAAEAVKTHTDSKSGVKSQLEKLSRKWRKKLNERGNRQNGTHEGWKLGMKKPGSKWYLPFSMASAAHAQTRYYNWTYRVNEKMIKIQQSMRAAGAL